MKLLERLAFSRISSALLVRRNGWERSFQPSSRKALRDPPVEYEQAHYAALNREPPPYRNGREPGALQQADQCLETDSRVTHVLVGKF